MAEKGLTVTSVRVGTTLPFLAGDYFSAADITGLVTVDFAAKAIGLPMPKEHKAVQRWFEKLSSRPRRRRLWEVTELSFEQSTQK